MLSQATQSEKFMNTAPYPRTIYTLLCMLSMQPMSGYDIKRALKHMVQYFWSESDGQIYPGLKRCLKDELIENHDDAAPTIKHSFKKCYRITERGHLILNHWLQHNAFKATQRDEGLLKLTFYDDSQQAIAQRVVKARLANATKQLEKLKQSNYTELLPQAHTTLPNWPHIHSYHKMMLEAEIKWAESYLSNQCPQALAS